MSTEFESEQFAEYSAIAAERDTLAAQSETASSFTRDLYLSGVAAADERLSELRDDPDFQKRVANLYGPVDQAYRELDLLESAVTNGLINPEQIALARTMIKEQIASSPDLQLARTLFAGTSVVSQEVELNTAIPVVQIPAALEAGATPPPTDPEAVKQPKAITILFKGDVIQIGEQGKIIKTSTRIHEGQNDYSQERVKVLEVLINHGGEMVKANDLWNEAFPGVPYDRQAMSGVRAWMDKLTYRRQPIVCFNGKRGPASAYGIVDFDVTSVRRPKAPVQIDRTITAAEAGPNTAAEKSSTPAERTASNAESVEFFPLSSYETLVVAEFLTINEGVMAQLGLPKLDKNFMNELRQIPTEAAQTAMINDYGSVPDARRVYLGKLQQFFKDDAKVMSTMSVLTETDTRYPVFEYFCDMEGDDRWELIGKLVNGQPGIDIQGQLPKRGGTSITHAGGFQVIDGERYAKRGTPPRAFQPVESLGTPASGVSAQATGQFALESVVEVDLPTAPSEVIQPTPVKNTASNTALETVAATAPLLPSGAESSADNDTDIWEKDFKQAIGQAITQLAEDGILKAEPISARIVSRISKSSKLGTGESLARLATAGIIKPIRRINPADYLMEPEVIVTSHLFNQFQRTVLSKNDRASQKRALRLIKEATDSFLAKQ